MRIVAGNFKSRVIKAVNGINTRPTQDKIKESIFNIIGPFFAGGIMLDLFGGSGNVGFEGMSRGIDQCIFVDSSMEAIKTIKENASSLGILDNCRILKLDYKKALVLFNEEHLKFDLVFIDPPYAKQRIHEILNFLTSNQMISDDGLVVCECSKEDEFEDKYLDLIKIKETIYGITRISVYKRKTI